MFRLIPIPPALMADSQSAHSGGLFELLVLAVLGIAVAAVITLIADAVRRRKDQP